MTRYTRLETAVMDALAHDLRDQVPDLARQFASGQVRQRRNSGFGLFTEIVFDPGRPLPPAGPTGDLGTVHAMVGNLPDPIAFRARVRDGVLLGLLGDSYGQDTRAIDFATVPFRQVFTVDAQGRSIPFEPTGSPPPAAAEPPRYRPQAERPAPARPSPVQPSPARAKTAPGPARGPSPSPKSEASQPAIKVTGLLVDPKVDQAFDRFAKQAFGAEPADAVPMSKDEKTSLRVFLWTGLFALGAILVFVFDVSPVFVFVVGMILGRFLQTDSGLSALKRGAEEVKKAQARSS